MKKKNKKIKKVMRHLKGDIKTFKKEAGEDRELIHELKESPRMEKKEERKEKKSKKKDPKKSSKNNPGSKFEKVMKEWGAGKLHSSSKKGPKVKSQRQALAIAFSEQRRAKNKRK
jgi:Sec-independent protein translocase protein TatA